MAMKPTTHRNLRLALLGATAGVLAGLLAGCRNQPDRAIHGEMFPPDEQVRPVDRMVEAQSAAAARADGTLNAYHFDRGGALNSLGREKIDLMLRDDDETTPLVVHLDLRDRRGASGDCEQSVRRHLADRGVVDVAFRAGPNFEYTRPARDGLRGLRKFDGRGDEASAETDNPLANVQAPGTPPSTRR